MKVGVVGLGAMGKAIAHNLLKAGYQVTVWNRSPHPVEELVQAGATRAADIREALQGDVVLSVLFDDVAVRTVFLESGALASAARTGLVHACLSTISIPLAQELAAEHERNGVGYVAAPVFGRPAAAAAASLNFVTAGTQAATGVVNPVLSALGRTWPVGVEPHHANLAKLAGNFLIGSAVEAMAEGAALLHANGANAPAFLSVMAETLFASPIYRLYAGACGGGPSPGARSGLALPLKDNGLLLEAARSAGAYLPLAELVRNRLQKAQGRGLGDHDWSEALATIATERGGESDRRV